ncbi:MAG: SMP-30/gluconolactonase/LRE family protein [Planctomycetota bacterium]|jgi:sugar lactone lactonase YvrE|nr:SMP-30/gluconolactonase/LRE family protein [Planctomycetota bacterium]
MHSDLRPVSSHSAQLGEGPRWWAEVGRLLWVDIDGGLVLTHDPATGQDQILDLDEKVGCVTPTTTGDFIAGLASGIARIDAITGTVDLLHSPEKDKPKNRFNDGAVDPAGRLWAGTMGPDRGGALYRLDHDGSLHTMLTGIGTSNGLCWSLDNATFYYIDTPTAQVRIFDYDVDIGALGTEHEPLPIPAADMGHPDGMTIDDEGMLWIAHWGGSRVTRWDPRARQCTYTIAMPAERVTAPWFGGDGSDLYITTAAPEKDKRQSQPDAGRLFCCRVDVTGPAAPLCRLD